MLMLGIACKRGLMIDFVYLLPLQLDPNRYLRKAIEEESLLCEAEFRFHQIETLDVNSLEDRIVLFGSFYSSYWNLDLYDLCAQIRKNKHSRIAHWTCEDPHENDCSTQYKRLFDVVFTNDYQCVSDYLPTQGVFLPMASTSFASQTDPVDDARQEESAERHNPEEAFDLFFCGVAYPNRLKVITSCLDSLAPYRCLFAGPGWSTLSGKIPNLTVLNRLEYKQVVDHYVQDRVILNLSRHLPLADHKSRAGFSPTPRSFELAALGCCQIAATPFDPEFRCFSEAEIPRFSNSESLARHLHHFLDPEKGASRRSKMASAVKKIALAHHLYRNRLVVIRDWARAC